jgi:hypothetical protein
MIFCILSDEHITRAGDVLDVNAFEIRGNNTVHYILIFFFCSWFLLTVYMAMVFKIHQKTPLFERKLPGNMVYSITK